MNHAVVYQDQELTSAIIAAAIEVHKHLGPGLLESAYHFCLALEFEDRGLKYKEGGLKYKSEVTVPLNYRGGKLDCGFRADFLVEDKIVVELKSVDILVPIYEAQLLTYLRLLDKQVGLLINFNVIMLKSGIRRCVMRAKDPLSFSGQGPGNSR